MFAIQFISGELFPLKKSDSIESALLFMDDWNVNELPVVEGGKILGFVSEKALQTQNQERIDLCMDVHIDPYIINENTHLFDIWLRMHQYQFETLAVLNADEQFLGIVSLKDLGIQSFAHSTLMQEGSTLVIKVQAIQYSLAEISRICESNDAKIIYLFVEPIMDSENTLYVSLKMNKVYLNHVIASLERFGYQIIHTNSPLDPNQSLDDRYNWLVKYLNT
ncbi:MAG: CBS domain-containing protein [bacterium]|nr:CBS domain-containing protein [bacterium]